MKTENCTVRCVPGEHHHEAQPFAPAGYLMDAQANVFVCVTCNRDADRGHARGCEQAAKEIHCTCL